MLKHRITSNSQCLPYLLPYFPSHNNNSIKTAVTFHSSSSITARKYSSAGRPLASVFCRARRRVIYDNEDDEEEDDQEYGHNTEIAMLEFYSQSVRNEALLVKAVVNEEEVEVLIFKGFSSCLSYGTCPDPSKSVLPARAVINCVDRIKGPFDPSNIEYLEKGLTVEDIKARVLPMAN